MKKYFYISATLLLLGLANRAGAQGSGSTITYGGSVSGSTFSIATGDVHADIAETLYIGPGTYEIDGEWQIFSKFIDIDPQATISGSGTIKFFNPGDLSSFFPGIASTATSLDGNTPVTGTAASIGCNVQIFNDQGVILTAVDAPADFLTAGWINNPTSTLYIGKDLSFEVDNGHLTLGTGLIGDLRFSSAATVSNYRPARMVITNNSILSHVVKEGYTSAFTFPVGIAAADFTPAQITNASANTVSVSVQDYTNSTSAEALTGATASGMNRTWHIFGSTAGISATVNLQHNTVTDQAGFSETSHFVTQWGTVVPNPTGDNVFAYSTSPWQTNTPGTFTLGTLVTGSATLTGSSMRSRVYPSLSTSASAAQTYFSKSSDAVHPLPVTLIEFEATPKRCDVEITWKTGVQTDAVNYRLLHSTDGASFSSIATFTPDPNNSNYSYVHKTPGSGKHYYRLEMEERFADTHYSPTRIAETDCGANIETVIEVFPNPATDVITVRGMVPNVLNIVRLLDVNGKVVLEKQTMDAVTQIDISRLPSAHYTLQLSQTNAVIAKTQIVKP